VTRSIMRAAEWTLTSETRDDVPQAVFSAVCLTCGEESAACDNSSVPVEIWALKHTGRNPEHRQFKATMEGFWRVTPAEGNPYRERDAQGT
jgi:hypothetical protein